MNKIKHYDIPHSKKERIELSTGLLDCNKKEILTGDFYYINGTSYEGPVMWNRYQKCYGIFMGLWYKNMDPMNPDCYGKFIKIPQDNGMRMELIPVVT